MECERVREVKEGVGEDESQSESERGRKRGRERLRRGLSEKGQGV